MSFSAEKSNQPSLGAILLGITLGVLVYAIWVTPYWIYTAWYDRNISTVASSSPLASAGTAEVPTSTTSPVTEHWLAKTLGPRPWLGRVMSSIVNLFTLIAFFVAMSLLYDRRRHIKQQKRAFELSLLGADEEALLLPEDALEARKRIKQLPEAEKQLILVQLLSTGLQRARANWSADDVAQAIKNQLDLITNRVEASYSIVRYLAWAIPSIGFIGTVMGVGSAMYAIGDKSLGGDKMQAATEHLHMAFDTTLVALILSIVLMYVLHRIQAEEDDLLARSAMWCMDRLATRMHIAAEV